MKLKSAKQAYCFYTKSVKKYVEIKNTKFRILVTWRLEEEEAIREGYTGDIWQCWWGSAF